jgi:hypothetical protein
LGDLELDGNTISIVVFKTDIRHSNDPGQVSLTDTGADEDGRSRFISYGKYRD